MIISSSSKALPLRSANVVASALSSPGEDSLIVLPEQVAAAEAQVAANPGGPLPPNSTLVGSSYKYVLNAVIFITVVSFVAQLVIPGMWPTPTANQQVAFDAVATAFKGGFGMFIGLLGGKAL